MIDSDEHEQHEIAGLISQLDDLALGLRHDLIGLRLETRCQTYGKLLDILRWMAEIPSVSEHALASHFQQITASTTQEVAATGVAAPVQPVVLRDGDCEFHAFPDRILCSPAAAGVDRRTPSFEKDSC